MTDPTPDVPMLRRLLAEDDLEAVLTAHTAWGGEDEFDHCDCGWMPEDDCAEPFTDHRAHVATALRAALAEVTP